MSLPSTITKTVPAGELRRPSVGRRMRKALPVYTALSPYFFFFLVFAAIPMIFTLLLAFTDWSGLGRANFVGLENFRYLVSDHLFYKSLGNTLILWAMGTIPTLIIATIVALGMVANAVHVPPSSSDRSAFGAIHRRVVWRPLRPGESRD